MRSYDAMNGQAAPARGARGPLLAGRVDHEVEAGTRHVAVGVGPDQAVDREREGGTVGLDLKAALALWSTTHTNPSMFMETPTGCAQPGMA